MKKDKFTAQDIIDRLHANNENRTKKISEDFYKAFISSIEEALQTREPVKIKDLGIFKLNWIAPRKSVNVQTGEQITIDGYYKVIFVPDSSLKKNVNKPFEHLETVVINAEAQNNQTLKSSEEQINPIVALEEQANEIKGILSEIQDISAVKINEEKEELIVVEEVKEEIANQPKEVDKESEGEEKETIVEKVKEKIVSHSHKKEKKTASSKNYISFDDIPVYIVPEEKKKRKWLWIILICLLVIIGGIVALYFLNKDFNKWAKPLIDEDTEIPFVYKEDSIPITDRVIKIMQEQEEVSLSKEEPVTDEWEKIFNSRFDNVSYITTVQLSSGERLAYYAEKYYASPHFWVYIYEANKDKISNPNVVLEGMLLKIPKLDSRITDINNPVALEKAAELEKMYLK